MAKLLKVGVVGLFAAGGIALLAREIESRMGPDFLTIRPRGNSSVAKARAFTEFPVYSAGPSFRGLRLGGVYHVVKRTKEPGVTIRLSFAYGSCDIRLWKGKADGGCGLPLSIENWPACKKSIRGLGFHGDPGESITIRGVPGALYAGQGRLALATGKTTIVIYGRGREFLLNAARSLRGVNTPVATAVNLPMPARGPLDRALKC
jgi:hypothetical protein